MRSRNRYLFRPPVIPLNESKGKVLENKGGSWIFRNIPRDLMKKVKIAAAVEGKSIKALLIEA
jgi:hypothetical protein